RRHHSWFVRQWFCSLMRPAYPCDPGIGQPVRSDTLPARDGRHIMRPPSRELIQVRAREVKMDSLVKVLMVEPAAFDADMLKRIIKRSGLMFVAERVDTPLAFEAALSRFEPDIVLSDFAMPGFAGMQALQMLRRLRPQTPFVFVSRTVGEERAVEALREGAADYVLKDNTSRL